MYAAVRWYTKHGLFFMCGYLLMKHIDRPLSRHWRILSRAPKALSNVLIERKSHQKASSHIMTMAPCQEHQPLTRVSSAVQLLMCGCLDALHAPNWALIIPRRRVFCCPQPSKPDTGIEMASSGFLQVLRRSPMRFTMFCSYSCVHGT